MEIREINNECDEYDKINKKLKVDLASCQKHL